MGIVSSIVRAASAKVVQRRRWAAILTGLGAAGLGCGAPLGGSEESAEHATTAIIGGSVSTPERDAVVLLRVDLAGGSWSDCSGTLLSPRIVATAKHCVSAVAPGGFACLGDGELVQDGTGAGTFGDLYEASSISIHVGAIPSDKVDARGKKVVATNATNACRDDFALIVLDRPVSVASYVAIQKGPALRAGNRVTIVGYGMGDRAAGLARRDLSNVRVLDVGIATPGGANPGATTPARTFVLGGDTACFGDSGGPALSPSTGALLGVYSRITGDCFASESRNTFTMTSSFDTLVADAFAETGERLPRGADSTLDAGGVASVVAGDAPCEGADDADTEACRQGSPHAAATVPDVVPTGCAAGEAHVRAMSEMWRSAFVVAMALAAVGSSRRRGRRAACVGARCRTVQGG